jgi:hypothetical protein
MAADHDPSRLLNVAVLATEQSHARVLLDKQDRGGNQDMPKCPASDEDLRLWFAF